MTLDNDTPIDQIRDFFAHDLFAYEACGCRIVEASQGHAVTAFDITPTHRNAMGAVMGGAIFTLADYALAVACNVGEKPTVSVSNSIEFLSSARGERLIATCDVDKSGRSLGFYTVDVRDELGTHVARMSATCFRRS
jgi:acyl-CoA thioesterase